MSEAFEQLLLPERKVNWRTLGTSFLAQSLLVFLLLEAGILQPERLLVATQHLTYTPLVEKTRPAEEMQRHPRMRLLPAPAMKARLVVPGDVEARARQTAALVAPKVVFAAPKIAPALVRPGGAMPAIVHTGSFGGSSATPTIVRPAQQVQTGGFGDPNGVPAQGKGGQGRLVMARMGGFDMPVGAGSGNGAGGTRGAPGNVASAGFGDSVATPGHGDGRSSGRGNVHAGGFGDVSTQSAAPQRTVLSAPATTPVEILSKPKPVYTEEARRLGLQGEVLVQVLFAADGQAHVLGVVQGLGHGLDQAAANAASQIRFKPAQQSGRPVDSTATVHVVFQLAY